MYYNLEISCSKIFWVFSWLFGGGLLRVSPWWRFCRLAVISTNRPNYISNQIRNRFARKSAGMTQIVGLPKRVELESASSSGKGWEPTSTSGTTRVFATFLKKVQEFFKVRSSVGLVKSTWTTPVLLQKMFWGYYTAKLQLSARPDTMTTVWYELERFPFQLKIPLLKGSFIKIILKKIRIYHEKKSRKIRIIGARLNI